LDNDGSLQVYAYRLVIDRNLRRGKSLSYLSDEVTEGSGFEAVVIEETVYCRQLWLQACGLDVRELT
jgi:hypothetical protein